MKNCIAFACNRTEKHVIAGRRVHEEMLMRATRSDCNAMMKLDVVCAYVVRPKRTEY